jgi:hypothetical protein
MDFRVCKKCLIEKDILLFATYKVRGLHGFRGVCIECRKIQILNNERKKRLNKPKGPGRGGHNKKYHCPLLKKLVRMFSNWDYRERNGVKDTAINALNRIMLISFHKKNGIRLGAINAKKKQRLYLDKYISKNQLKYKSNKIKNQKKGRENLSDWYVRSVFTNNGFSPSPEMIEEKRLQLKIRRTIKQLSK